MIVATAYPVHVRTNAGDLLDAAWCRINGEPISLHVILADYQNGEEQLFDDGHWGLPYIETVKSYPTEIYDAVNDKYPGLMLRATKTTGTKPMQFIGMGNFSVIGSNPHPRPCPMYEIPFPLVQQ